MTNSDPSTADWNDEESGCGFEYDHSTYAPDDRYPNYLMCRECGAEFEPEDDR